MTTLLLEPFAGISGDMTVGALLDLGVPIEWLRDRLTALPLGGYRISAEPVMRGAFAGTRFLVEVDEGHPHRTMGDVRKILEPLAPAVRDRALAAFERLAAAEGRAHARDPESVHFHEVGAIDSIVDVTAAALLLEHLGVGRILATRVRVGTGEVECRHGRIPVPAPGTAALLEGFPVLYADGEGETTTPTGAAFLAAWAAPAPPELALRPDRTGYGAGAREGTVLPNLLRATLGAEEADAEVVVELAANVDDQAPEALAYAAEELLAAGALDVWITPVVMKKGRPGVLVSVLAGRDRAAALERLLFAETSTFGVRRREWERTRLDREHVTVATPWGEVRVKIGRRAGEAIVRAPEYEDCARVAREHGVPLREVYAAALKAV